MPPDVYAQFGMERVQEFINSQDPNIVRALNQHALERLTERGITLVDLQRERIYLRDLGHPRSGWDGPRFSSGLYADLLPYGAEYTISGIATPLKIKVAPNGEVNKPDNAQIVDSTFSADHLPQGLTPVIAYRVTKVTDAHGEHEVRTFLTQPEMEALVRKAHLKLPEGIKLDVFVGRLLAAASSPHVIAKAAEDLPRQTDFNAERMTEDQLFYLYSLSRHNSPYLGDKQRVGYADMLLAPTNPLIHALENAK